MKTKILTTFLLATLTCGGMGISTSHLIPAVAKTPRATNANGVYAQANAAVVAIRGTSSLGSGFIISADGYVITNAHVIKGQPAVVTLMMADKTEIPADVVGFGKNQSTGQKIPDSCPRYHQKN
jgi:S1-C subfamily serine protease